MNETKEELAFGRRCRRADEGEQRTAVSAVETEFAAKAIIAYARAQGGRGVKVEPEFYREQAEKSRALANRSEDPDTRAHLLGVAEQYEKLARDAEASG